MVIIIVSNYDIGGILLDPLLHISGYIVPSPISSQIKLSCEAFCQASCQASRQAFCHVVLSDFPVKLSVTHSCQAFCQTSRRAFMSSFPSNFPSSFLSRLSVKAFRQGKCNGTTDSPRAAVLGPGGPPLRARAAAAVGVRPRHRLHGGVLRRRGELVARRRLRGGPHHHPAAAEVPVGDHRRAGGGEGATVGDGPALPARRSGGGAAVRRCEKYGRRYGGPMPTRAL